MTALRSPNVLSLRLKARRLKSLGLYCQYRIVTDLKGTNLAKDSENPSRLLRWLRTRIHRGFPQWRIHHPCPCRHGHCRGRILYHQTQMVELLDTRARLVRDFEAPKSPDLSGGLFALHIPTHLTFFALRQARRHGETCDFAL